MDNLQEDRVVDDNVILCSYKGIDYTKANIIRIAQCSKWLTICIAIDFALSREVFPLWFYVLFIAISLFSFILLLCAEKQTKTTIVISSLLFLISGVGKLMAIFYVLFANDLLCSAGIISWFRIPSDEQVAEVLAERKKDPILAEKQFLFSQINTNLFTVLKKCVVFRGRASRKEFIFLYLWFGLLLFYSMILNFSLKSTPYDKIGIFVEIFAFFIFMVPFISGCVRRLHDIEKFEIRIALFSVILVLWGIILLLLFCANPESAIMLAKGSIPLVFLVIFVWLTCKDSQPGENKYGPNPKGIDIDDIER